MAKDIGKQPRPPGWGGLNKRTLLICNGRVIHTAEGNIIKKWEGKELEKSKPLKPSIITVVDEKYSIHEITDRSENYNLTRVVELKKLSPKQLKALQG